MKTGLCAALDFQGLFEKNKTKKTTTVVCKEERSRDGERNDTSLEMMTLTERDEAEQSVAELRKSRISSRGLQGRRGLRTRSNQSWMSVR